LAAKFVEAEFEKVDRLMEIAFRQAPTSVRSAEFVGIDQLKMQPPAGACHVCPCDAVVVPGMWWAVFCGTLLLRLIYCGV
jgi:hypothetical protein